MRRRVVYIRCEAGKVRDGKRSKHAGSAYNGGWPFKLPKPRSQRGRFRLGEGTGFETSISDHVGSDASERWPCKEESKSTGAAGVQDVVDGERTNELTGLDDKSTHGTRQCLLNRLCDIH